MSQHDLTIDNQGFPAFRADLNNALQALGSTQSGTSAPSPTFANQLWYDTTNNQLKIRNEDNDAWITLLTLDQSGDVVSQLAATIAVLSAGTAGAPALTTSGDTNTGIFFPAADTIAFAEGGVESMRIDSNGQVGIGTNSPAVPLDVNKAGSNDKAVFRNATRTLYVNVDGSGGGIYTGAGQTGNSFGLDAANNTAIISTNGAERLRINTSGSVGIGTSSPNNRLHVNSGASAISTRFQTTSTVSVIDFADTNTVSAPYLGSIGDSLYIGTTSAERMRVTSSGSVGIGTTSPSVRLEVNGGVNSAHLVLTGTANRGLRISTSNPNGQNDGTVIYNAQDPDNLGQHVWQRNGSERMRINADGDICIGRTSNFGSGERLVVQTEGSAGLAINRQNDDGNLVGFFQGGTAEGSISVSGTTVSYNGGHLSRYAQTITPKDDSLLKGTVLSNLDEMNEYIDSVGNQVKNEQLNKVKVSNIEGDANVAGVFVNWYYDNAHNVDEINMAMTGDMIIRIAEGVTVQKGDLLISAGDGTAKPQGDDIVRSKTIAKVTSNHVTCTYEDGSYCVPCVLMAC